MAGIETRSNLPRALWPGVHSWTGQEYNRYPPIVDEIFDVESSKMAFEEDVELDGYGLVPVKNEASPTEYDGLSQGPTSRYTHVAYGLGFIVTREEFDDNQYAKVAQARSKALARSYRTTREVVGSNVLNRGFLAAYLGGDGQPLFSTAHPTRAGIQSNMPAVSADFSEAAVEDMTKLMMNAVDATGIPLRLRGMKIVVGADSVFDVTRVLKSVGRPGTANNDINATKEMGLFPGGMIFDPYLTATDAWFIITDIPDGLKCYNRTPFEVRRDNDFDTLNLKVAGFERYSFGWSDWRGAYGNPGV